MPPSLSSHPHLWMLQSQGQLCCGGALPAALCSGQLRTQQLGPLPDWNPLNFKNAQNSSDWSNCNKYTNHSLHFKESGHQRTCGSVYFQLMLLQSCTEEPQHSTVLQKLSQSLYKHHHLPADQTAGMTPTPVALSLGEKHSHLVRFVIFTELFSFRHCTKKVIIHVITQTFWFDPGVHILNSSHYAHLPFFIFHCTVLPEHIYSQTTLK